MMSVAGMAREGSVDAPARRAKSLHATAFAGAGDNLRAETRAPLDIVGRAMADIHTTTVPSNDLPIHRIPLPGTRALTVLVAFDAGARNERPQENGMAHFLEHLVFKGGEKYPHYRDVNETAERLGGVLNAYTSHDLVAFHITVRAESAGAAIDLLSDFVGRPRLDGEELDRERGVVIQEINRAFDQPSMVAEYLIDRAAFGEHPLGRTVLGPEENLRSFTREGIVAFRERRWAGARGGAFLVGNLDHLPAEEDLQECFARFPALPAPPPYEPSPEFAPQTLVEQRETNQSHLRMIYRPDISVSNVRERAALSIYSTLLGGSMGSRLFDEIREKRGLCYSVYAMNHAFADVPILQLGSGLESAKCIEAYTRMREIVDELRDDGPTEEEVQRARAYAAGRVVLSFENTNAVARYAANQKIVFDESIDPDEAIAALDAVTFDEVREVASGVADKLAIACVGPHAADEF
jgi:predicted Zn-dependent peptidase